MGPPSPEKAAFFGVTERTLRAWLTGRARVPGAVARLALARYRGLLEAIYGPDAAELVFLGGMLLVPGWRRGITLHELRTMWVRIQAVAALESRIGLLERALEARNLEAESSRLEASVAEFLKSVREAAPALLAELLERV